MQRIDEADKYPPGIDKLTQQQADYKATWGRTADWQNTSLGGVNAVHCVPLNSTTITSVNPLDPASVEEAAEGGWSDAPAGYGPVVPASRLF